MMRSENNNVEAFVLLFCFSFGCNYSWHAFVSVLSSLTDLAFLVLFVSAYRNHVVHSNSRILRGVATAITFSIKHLK